MAAGLTAGACALTATTGAATAAAATKNFRRDVVVELTNGWVDISLLGMVLPLVKLLNIDPAD
jgi:cobalamin biosynthesis protein CbiD